MSTLRRLFALSLLFVLLASAASDPLAWGADKKADDKNFKRVLPSSVVVISEIAKDASTGKRKFTQGTGTLVDQKRRLVLTNYHCVDDRDSAVVIFPMFKEGKLVTARPAYMDVVRDNKGIAGKVLARSRQRDLAIIQLATLPSDTPALPLATSSIKPKAIVYNVGNPVDSQELWLWTPRNVLKVEQKKYRSLGEEGKAYDIDAVVVQTDAPARKGESGGPLVNDKGELVGVTQASSQTTASGPGKTPVKADGGYFIDVTEVKSFLDSKDVAKIDKPDSPTVASKDPDPDKKKKKPPVKKK